MNCFRQGFYNIGARMLLTIFQLKFHSKEVTFPGRSLHRGWHRNFRVPLMFKEALFSGAVVTPTARAKSQCKHAGKELSSVRNVGAYWTAKRWQIYLEKIACEHEAEVIRKPGGNPRLVQHGSAATTFATRDCPPSLIGVAMWNSQLWLDYCVAVPPSW